MSGKHLNYNNSINIKKIAVVVGIILLIIVIGISIFFFTKNKNSDDDKKEVNVEIENIEEKEAEVKTLDEIVADFNGEITEKVNEDMYYITKEGKEYTAYSDGDILEGKILIWTGDAVEPSNKKDDNIDIYTGEELAWIAKKVISGDESFKDVTINLRKSIDLGAKKDSEGNWSGNKWTPIIGISNEENKSKDSQSQDPNVVSTNAENLRRFAGKFNGNNFQIRGMYIDNETDYQGLFGFSSGEISNLTINASYVKGKTCVGALVGLNLGTVSNCIVKNTQVEGESKVGGLIGIGMTDSTLTECEVVGNSLIKAPEYVGGIVGYLNNNTELRNCRNIANVIGNNYIGGISGIAFYGTSLIGCTNSSLNIVGEDYVGGLIGYSQAEINTCNSIGKGIISGKNYVGGLVGSNYTMGQILNCYNEVNVTIKGDNVGGLVGINNSSITDSYNKGKISVTESSGIRIGGICGQNSSNSIISRCYNIGEIKNTSADGVCGVNFCNVEFSYCITGLGYGNQTNGEMVEPDKLKNELLDILGESFKADENNLNDGYPVLHWQM